MNDANLGMAYTAKQAWWEAIENEWRSARYSPTPISTDITGGPGHSCATDIDWSTSRGFGWTRWPVLSATTIANVDSERWHDQIRTRNAKRENRKLIREAMRCSWECALRSPTVTVASPGPEVEQCMDSAGASSILEGDELSAASADAAATVCCRITFRGLDKAGRAGRGGITSPRFR